ncbi:MAG: hypothetical protein M3N95_04830 [Actinomycetota bacterium]|nr:hypothetical protein [Actinomycetota bacterium]
MVTTSYGAPLEYLDPEASALIPGRLVDCHAIPGAVWMEPDVAAAAEALRAIAADPAAARAAAAPQASRLRQQYAPEVVAQELLTGLRAIGILD